MLYLDFNKTGAETNNINKSVRCIINPQNYLPQDYTKIAVSKMDLCLNIPFMTVELQNPQIHYLNTDSTTKQYGKYSQDDGYYQLKNFKIYYADYNNGAMRYETRDIYFKNYEFEKNNIETRDTTTPNLKYYNNFNNYFIINHFNSFCKSINENIKNLLYDMWNDLTDASNLQTLFYTDNNNKLSCFMLLDNQTGSHQHVLINDPTDIGTDTKKFVLGFSKELYELLLSPFTYNKFSYNNEEYYAPDNNLVGKGSVFNIQYSTYSYDLIELNNIYYIDYAPTFTSLLITFNSTVSPLTVNVKTKNFILNDEGGDATLLNIPVIQKFQLNRSTEQLYKLVFSNSSITNNYSSINNMNLQRLELAVYAQDKFGYNYELQFNNNNEYIYVQLCVFN